MIETATFWKDGPEIATGEHAHRRTSAPRCSSCPPRRTPRRTARSPTPSGCCSGTTRPSSRRTTAAATCGSTTSWANASRRGWPTRPIRKTAPLQDLTWDYPVENGEPSADAVLREINGTGADGKALSGYTALKDDGTTSCGCWIYSGVYADEVNQSMRRKPGQEQDLDRRRVGLGVAGQPAGALQPRLRRPRRQTVERAQEARLVERRGVDRRRRPRLPGDHRTGLRPPRGRPGRRSDRR